MSLASYNIDDALDLAIVYIRESINERHYQYLLNIDNDLIIRLKRYIKHDELSKQTSSTL